MMKRTVNPARLAEGCVALLMGLGFLWLGLTRTYQHYVTPRTLPYLYFAAVALLAMAGLSFAKLYEVTHIRRYTHLLALLVPLALVAASTNVEGLWNSPLFPASGDSLNSATLQTETYTMPLTTISLSGLHPSQIASASSLSNFLRVLGGSIGQPRPCWPATCAASAWTSSPCSRPWAR